MKRKQVETVAQSIENSDLRYLAFLAEKGATEETQSTLRRYRDTYAGRAELTRTCMQSYRRISLRFNVVSMGIIGVVSAIEHQPIVSVMSVLAGLGVHAYGVSVEREMIESAYTPVNKIDEIMQQAGMEFLMPGVPVPEGFDDPPPQPAPFANPALRTGMPPLSAAEQA